MLIKILNTLENEIPILKEPLAELNDIINRSFKILEVIMAYNDDFFEEEENSAVIMCDNSDSKEFKRFKLFDRWYKKLKDKDVMKLDSAIETDYYSLYISLFVHNNNPWKNNVIKEYYRMISEEFTIPED